MTDQDRRAWLIEYTREDGERMRCIFLHNAIGDYRMIDPNATVTVMVPAKKLVAKSEPARIQCPKCHAHIKPGLHCAGNPPHDPCPLRPK